MQTILAVGVTIVDPRNAAPALRRLAYQVAAGWLVIGLVCAAIGGGLIWYAQRVADEMSRRGSVEIAADDFRPEQLENPQGEIRLAGIAQLDAAVRVSFESSPVSGARSELLIPVTGPRWREGDPVRIYLRAGMTDLTSSLVVTDGAVWANDAGVFALSSLVRPYRPRSLSGDLAATLRANGLAVADDVVLVSAIFDEMRDRLTNLAVTRMRNSAWFILYLGLILCGFGLLGRRRAMLPADG